MMRKLLQPLIFIAATLAAVPAAQADVRMRPAPCPFQSDVSYKILGASGETEGVGSEYQWMAMQRPGWRRTEQVLMTHGNRLYDLLAITNGRQSEIICFDITDFFGKSP